MISSTAEETTSTAAATAGRSRLLVVDDQEDIRALLDMWLSSHFEIILAEDGIDAMRLLREGQPFDAAILDVMMPKVDGFAVARAIHHADPDVPIIMLSAISDQANRARGAEVGVAKYFPKPFDPLQLRSTLQALTRKTGRRQLPTDEADPIRSTCGWAGCVAPKVTAPLCSVHQQLSDATGTFELRPELHAAVVQQVVQATDLHTDQVSAMVHRPRTASDAEVELFVRGAIHQVLGTVPGTTD